MKICSLSNMSRELTILAFIRDIIKNTKWDGLVFLVGGAVRDSVLGKLPKDLDFTIEVNHGGILFAEWLYKILSENYPDLYISTPVIYNRYETAKVIIDGILQGVDLDHIELEFVQTRGEVYEGNSRKPAHISFVSLEEDLRRRDLSINAMAKNISNGSIVDPWNGMEDLKNKVLKAPDSNYDELYSEDPLRILRAVRFASKYTSFKMDSKMLSEIKKNKEGIKSLSKERIRDELNKILLTPKPSKGLSLLADLELLPYVFQSDLFSKLIGLEQGAYHDSDAWVHTLRVVDNVPNNLNLRLAALFHDIGKSNTQSKDGDDIHFYRHEEEGGKLARNIMRELKYSTEQIRVVCKIIESHMRPKNTRGWGDKAVRKLIKDIGDDLDLLLDLVHADNISHAIDKIDPEDIPLLRERIEYFKQQGDLKKLSDFPIKDFGTKVMNKYNLKPGPLIGKIKKFAENLYVDDPNISEEDVFFKIEAYFGLDSHENN